MSHHSTRPASHRCTRACDQRRHAALRKLADALQRTATAAVSALAEGCCGVDPGCNEAIAQALAASQRALAALQAGNPPCCHCTWRAVRGQRGDGKRPA